MVLKEVKHVKPVVGMMSCVGIMGKDFPLSFGNYFSFSSDNEDDWYGLYCCNMWAENLKEFIRLHPEIEDLEVTVFSGECRSWDWNKNGWAEPYRTHTHEVCVVTDTRVPAEWLNHKPCVTGCGYGSREICEEIHAWFGLDTTNSVCGCEAPNEPSKISRCTVPKEGTHIYRCHSCKRSWTEHFMPVKPLSPEEQKEIWKNIKVVAQPGFAMLDNRRVALDKLHISEEAKEELEKLDE